MEHCLGGPSNSTGSTFLTGVGDFRLDTHTLPAGLYLGDQRGPEPSVVSSRTLESFGVDIANMQV